MAMGTVLVFAAVACWLGLGGRADPRARNLAVFYLLIAAAFAHQFLPDGDGGTVLALLRGAAPDAFLPLFLWRFVARFPHTVRFSRADWLCRLAERTSLAVGLFFFAVTVALGLGWTPWLQGLGRLSTGPYWTVILALVVPALPVAWLRSRSSLPEEQRRVALFTVGLVIGLAPMVTILLAESLFPGVDRLMANNRRMEALALEAFLLLMPCVTAYSVLVNRVFDVRVVVGQALRYVFARATLTAIAASPIVALAVFAYRHRNLSLAELVSSGRGVAVAVLVGIGLVLWTVRPLALRALDRRFLRATADLGRDLPQLVVDIRNASGREELARLTSTRLGALLHATRVGVLVRSGLETFVGVGGDVPDISIRSALGALVAADAGPLAVGPEEQRSCFAALPPGEQAWVLGAQASILVPLVGSHDARVGVILVGQKRNRLPYDADDLSFLAGVAPAAALALEVFAQQAHDELEPAAECPHCGSIASSVAAICGCGSPRRTAMVPAVIAGKFRVERRIGAGGMGVVYAGRDVTLSRTVALKTLPRLSVRAAERLSHEAQVMASVVHPNLATIYSLEQWRNTPILVVEFLEGGTFAARLRRGPQPTNEVLQLGVVLAAALEHLHQCPILHRDVKPSNIAFSRSGVPKLLDFGIAEFLSTSQGGQSASEATAGSEPDTTRSVVNGGLPIAGTPLYLSPEAACGCTVHTDFDLWGLAMVLYEAIAGRHPFAARTTPEVLEKIRAADVPDLRRFRPDCADSVASAFKVMLGENRSQRPRTAAALGGMLATLTQGEVLRA